MQTLFNLSHSAEFEGCHVTFRFIFFYCSFSDIFSSLQEKSLGDLLVGFDDECL